MRRPGDLATLRKSYLFDLAYSVYDGVMGLERQPPQFDFLNRTTALRQAEHLDEDPALPDEYRYMVGARGVVRALERLAAAARERAIPFVVFTVKAYPGLDPKYERDEWRDGQRELLERESRPLGFHFLNTYLYYVNYLNEHHRPTWRPPSRCPRPTVTRGASRRRLTGVTLSLARLPSRWTNRDDRGEPHRASRSPATKNGSISFMSSLLPEPRRLGSARARKTLAPTARPWRAPARLVNRVVARRHRPVDQRHDKAQCRRRIGVADDLGGASTPRKSNLSSSDFFSLSPMLGGTWSTTASRRRPQSSWPVPGRRLPWPQSEGRGIGDLESCAPPLPPSSRCPCRRRMLRARRRRSWRAARAPLRACPCSRPPAGPWGLSSATLRRVTTTPSTQRALFEQVHDVPAHVAVAPTRSPRTSVFQCTLRLPACIAQSSTETGGPQAADPCWNAPDIGAGDRSHLWTRLAGSEDKPQNESPKWRCNSTCAVSVESDPRRGRVGAVGGCATAPAPKTSSSAPRRRSAAPAVFAP